MKPQSMAGAVAGAILIIGASCSTIEVDLPDAFLVTTATSQDFKATTADDAIFWVQKYELPDRGDNLDFWVAALKNDFVENRGYVLLDEAETRTRPGRRGTQMTFEATTQGATYRYLIALFLERTLTGPVACVARFMAEKDQFETHVDAVKEAIRTTR